MEKRKTTWEWFSKHPKRSQETQKVHLTKSNSQTPSNKHEKEVLTRNEWDFDNVPESELVACCYWEYARESAFIRNVSQRCLQNWRAGGHWDLRLHADLQKAQSIGYPSDVILRGIFIAPNDPNRIDKPDAAPIANNFPQPWRELTASERVFRSRIRSDRTEIPQLPFERAYWTEASEIAKYAESRANEIFSAFDEVRRANPEASEVTLIEQGKLQPFPGITPSLIWESGKEFTVVAIDWGSFTKDEIVNYFRRWVKASRPRDIRGPNQQGRKRISVRVKLERLAIMRLLHRCTVAELRSVCPDAWKRYNTPNRRWRKDVEKAHAHFREFFPFLGKNEFPRSWPPKD
jgi:hypothetical protein